MAEDESKNLEVYSSVQSSSEFLVPMKSINNKSNGNLALKQRSLGLTKGKQIG
jgi:hypothetical protein